jgi:hypothetical protein
VIASAHPRNNLVSDWRSAGAVLAVPRLQFSYLEQRSIFISVWEDLSRACNDKFMFRVRSMQ